MSRDKVSRSSVSNHRRQVAFNEASYSPIARLLNTTRTHTATAAVRETIISTLLIASCLIVQISHQQSSISLNKAQWFVTNSNGSILVPAQVPGGIYSDLRRNNVLEQELLFGENDLAYRWVGREDWTYTTSFAIDEQIATSQSVKLVLHGVDTVSSIYLNGNEIGTTDNMFVRYKFDVKPHLKSAGLNNTLAIKFESPIKYGARRSDQSISDNHGKIIPPYCPSPAQNGECHVNFIRKMQASFSWDWGPAFPSMGIYKNIELEYGGFGLIRDILVETRRSASRVPEERPLPPTEVIVSSDVQAPSVGEALHNERAPPYFIPNDERRANSLDEDNRNNPQPSESTELPVLDDNWLLNVTLVAEMVQPSFSYNIRVEFNLNDTLHYESEHINVVSNSEAIIRLSFDLNIDTSRMRVKPWWPNNAGSQPLYRLTARIMPMPSSPDQHLPDAPSSLTPIDGLPLSAGSSNKNLALLQAQLKTLRSQAVPPAKIDLPASPEVRPDLMQQVSEKEILFGFRTVELIQEPITPGNADHGLTFNLRVNGVDLFAMGSNWIPASVLPENSNDIEHIRYLLQSAKDANMNMLRVWGGGLYESDEFYRLADEMGIMIWHDFMFACALYPTDDDFIASVRLEVEQQVQRLQHHPSIVIWAGNNENESAIAGPWWPEVLVWNEYLRKSYSKLYVDTVEPIVHVLDPTRPYVTSSPSNGIMSESQPNAISGYPNDGKFGDVHHYDYSADSFDWTVYPSTRFASEYGFQSYPSFDALASVSSKDEWKYPLSPNILHRQHRATGETEILSQIQMHFGDLKSGGQNELKTFIYLSQLNQAIAIKTETEFYRRNRFVDQDTKLGKTMGALYWQLNDVWQAPTWSSIEYGGKWKMLHYFARRFFFPIQVTPYLVQGKNTGGSDGLGPSIPGDSTQLVVDLVRDDMFHLIHSFNVTVRFFKWNSFSPIWQETVYVRNSRPRNVTRIYEQDLARIANKLGVISSGVFQVVIEQQARFEMSHIENYLMPVAPKKITEMRVAKIDIELIQDAAGASVGGAEGGSSSGEPPFEPSPNGPHADPYDSAHFKSASTRWACAYRLNLKSDSIAMFVWLDLNLIDSGAQTAPPQSPAPDQHIPNSNGSSDSEAYTSWEPEKLRQQHQSKFRPVDASGGNMLRYQFSDNAFNMFEPTKEIYLYLSKCLTENQVKAALEIRSLAEMMTR